MNKVLIALLFSLINPIDACWFTLIWLIAEVKGIACAPTKPGHCQNVSQPWRVRLCSSVYHLNPSLQRGTSYAKLFVTLSSTPKISQWAKGFLLPPKAVCSIRSTQQHYKQQKNKLLSELQYSQERFSQRGRAWSCTTFKICSTQCLFQLKDTSQTFQYPLRLPKI